VKLLTLSLNDQYVAQRKECTVSSGSLQGLMCDCERLGIAKFNLSNLNKYSFRSPVAKTDDIVFHGNLVAFPVCLHSVKMLPSS